MTFTEVSGTYTILEVAELALTDFRRAFTSRAEGIPGKDVLLYRVFRLDQAEGYLLPPETYEVSEIDAVMINQIYSAIGDEKKDVFTRTDYPKLRGLMWSLLKV